MNKVTTRFSISELILSSLSSQPRFALVMKCLLALFLSKATCIQFKVFCILTVNVHFPLSHKCPVMLSSHFPPVFLSGSDTGVKLLRLPGSACLHAPPEGPSLCQSSPPAAKPHPHWTPHLKCKAALNISTPTFRFLKS